MTPKEKAIKYLNKHKEKEKLHGIIEVAVPAVIREALDIAIKEQAKEIRNLIENFYWRKDYCIYGEVQRFLEKFDKQHGGKE